MNCGKTINDDSLYCQYCGIIVDKSVKVATRFRSLNEKTKEDFNRSSPAIYTGKLIKGYSIFSKPNTDSKRLMQSKDKDVNKDALTFLVNKLIDIKIKDVLKANENAANL